MYSQAKLYIQGKFIAIGIGRTEKHARLQASRIGYNILKEMCFTIVVSIIQFTIYLTNFVVCTWYHNAIIFS